MGTETHNAANTSITIWAPVKLKNPLMGTETRDVFHHIPRIWNTHVKLNNPLMGTETVS